MALVECRAVDCGDLCNSVRDLSWDSCYGWGFDDQRSNADKSDVQKCAQKNEWAVVITMDFIAEKFIWFGTNICPWIAIVPIAMLSLGIVVY